MNAVLEKKTLEFNSRETWLRGRKKGIGSSDIAGIHGSHDYMTPLDVYKSKVENNVIEPNRAMKDGIVLEERVAEEFEIEVQGIKLINPGDFCIFHIPDTIFLATPDRIYKRKDSNGKTQWGLVECKTTNSYLTGNEETDVKPYYYVQVQWQMHVTGFKEGWIAIYNPGSKQFETYMFEYDADFCKKLEEAAQDFWNNHIETMIPPKPVSKEDNEKLHPKEEKGKVLVADENQELLDKLDKYNELQETIKALKEKQDALKNELTTIMEDAEMITNADIPVATYKASIRRTLDTQKLKREKPETYEEYRKESVSRTFRVK